MNPGWSCLHPPWRRQRAGNTHLGTLGCSPPVMSRVCMASPNSINTQHTSGMCSQLSPTSTHTVGHSWHLCWRMSSAWVMPQLPWPLLWERRDVHPSGAECKKPLGPLKPFWGLTLLSLLQLVVAASFHPAVSQLLWLSPDRGLSPWQWEVTSGCGGQSDRCLTMQEIRWCLSIP